MSEIFKDRAVILRTFDFGESSTIAVVLTREHGKIRLLAKGAKNQRSSFFGNLQTGNLGEVVFYFREGRGLQLLKEIMARYVFDSSRGDLERLCIFQAGLEIVDRSIIEQEKDNRAFDVVEGFIGHVQSAEDPWVIFFALEVQLIEIMGHLPSLGDCEQCKKHIATECIRINPSSGEVTCEECGGEGDLLLSHDSAELLGRMCCTGFEHIDSIRVTPAVRREMGQLLHYIFLHHVDGYRLPKSLSFLRGVIEQ